MANLLGGADTQPNKLYRNQHNGTFKDAAVEAGLAFSSERAKARAGMGVDVADFENSGTDGVVITNFDNEMIGLYRASGKGFEDVTRARCRSGRRFQKTVWALAALFSTSIWTAGSTSRWPTDTSTTPCVIFAATSATRSRPNFLSNSGNGNFSDVSGGGWGRL